MPSSRPRTPPPIRSRNQKARSPRQRTWSSSRYSTTTPSSGPRSCTEPTDVILQFVMYSLRMYRPRLNFYCLQFSLSTVLYRIRNTFSNFTCACLAEKQDSSRPFVIYISNRIRLVHVFYGNTKMNSVLYNSVLKKLIIYNLNYISRQRDFNHLSVFVETLCKSIII
ncbi:Hypothetical_protein [Hexamita inflata]|uniref:Hypothetical_protein n=1 Tax=Hexamita inflata TaxID=28002 RepID=A0AA86NM33_9EUKA|nr:Hypothetical protein HINF_LOCUS10422 [Hexamita inflata]